MSLESKALDSLAFYFFQDLDKSLNDKGVPLTSSSRISFESLCKAYSLGLQNKLPVSYHLSSIDPGCGKTESICSLIRVWKEQEFPYGSILVAVKTKKEIASLIKRCGLNERDACYGVLVHNDELSEWGIGSYRINEAPLLFCTHEMLRRRVKSSFKSASDFHYKGVPRALRIWDESMLPSDPVCIRLDILAAVPATLGEHARDFCDALTNFVDDARKVDSGGNIKVPPSFRDGLGAVLAGIRRKDFSAGYEADDALAQLPKVLGRSVHIMGNGLLGKTLVGCSNSFPDDMKPFIILDASGRLRATYDLWMKNRGDLVRLAPTINDYSNLTIRVKKASSGRKALSNEIESRYEYKSSAQFVDAEPDKKTLVISYKTTRKLSVEDVMKGYAEKPANIEFLHWGLHQSTNDHRDIDRVLILGAWFKPNPVYTALFMAASALPAEDVSDDEVRRLRATELQHDWLQAITRASVRKNIGGVCGECEAFVIAPKNANPIKLLAAVFPGAEIIDETPTPEAKGQERRLMDVLLAAKAGNALMLQKERARNRADIPSRGRLSQILRKASTRTFLVREGIENSGQYFYFRYCEDE